MRFEDAGVNLRIACDYKGRMLRVQQNAHFGIGNLLPSWGEVATFSNEKEWDESHFVSQVTSEEVQIAIMWFWTDIERDLQEEEEKRTSALEQLENEIEVACEEKQQKVIDAIKRATENGVPVTIVVYDPISLRMAEGYLRLKGLGSNPNCAVKLLFETEPDQPNGFHILFQKLYY